MPPSQRTRVCEKQEGTGSDAPRAAGVGPKPNNRKLSLFFRRREALAGLPTGMKSHSGLFCTWIKTISS